MGLRGVFVVSRLFLTLYLRWLCLFIGVVYWLPGLDFGFDSMVSFVSAKVWGGFVLLCVLV